MAAQHVFGQRVNITSSLRCTLVSVYQKCLGEDFNRLNPVLRQIHGPNKEFIARGEIELIRPHSILTSVLCWMARLPLVRGTHPVMLKISNGPSKDQETWHRQFGPEIFQTVQREQHGKIQETNGQAILEFRCWEESGELHCQFGRCILFGVPLPALFGITGHAREWSDSANTWKFEVSIHHPVVGVLLHYNGICHVEGDTSLD